ncbi:phasin family protein [Microvirga pakistanensis]|uniref:phasin family protein n=1 Tax=Microvirga pakistanensis TaxID=1682650 RepID=UPI00106B27D0|nr:phasin family protein [Microvirga pakistanensis]
MTETRKTRTRSAKSAAPKADLIALAAEPVAEAAEIAQAAELAPAPTLSAASDSVSKASESIVFSLRDQGEALRQAVRETVAVSAKGALEVNDKIIQALQIQGHAALDLWRTAIDNSRLPDGLNAQTGAARQAFETASSQWKDVAETTARWMTRSVEPLQSAFLRQTR